MRSNFPSLVWSCVTALVVLVCSGQVNAKEYFGSFHGELIVSAEGDGRLLRLTHPYSFTDSAGKLWAVPAGIKVDGASIPQPLWSIVGGPFEDKYRNASVIHDHFCKTKTEKWEDVHLVFYNGMRAMNVGANRAKLMYGAVYAFGPRWVEGSSSDESKLISGQPILFEKAKTEILNYIADNDPSIAAINEISDRLAKTETIEQLEKILYENANCTPILSSELGAFSPNKTLVLCGLSAASKKQAAIKNLRTLVRHLNQLLTSQRLFLLPSVDEYVAEPDAMKWEKVKESSRNVNGLIKLGMRSALDVEQPGTPRMDIPTDDVFDILSSRSVMISAVLTGPPKSRRDMELWAMQYKALVQRLEVKLRGLEQQLSSISEY